MTTAPHDLEVEASLLGAMLLSSAATEAASATVTSSDFYKPAHGHVFAAIYDLWHRGQPVDAVTVADHLASKGTLELAGGHGTLLDLVAGAASTTNAGRYAMIVAEHAARRRIMQVALDVAQRASDLGDPAELVDIAKAGLAEVSLPVDVIPDGLWSVDEFLARPDDVQPPWVIKDLLRRGWRAVLVATEGGGKSLLLSQLAIAASQGIHPFGLYEIPPVRTMLIDLENPDERLMTGFAMVDTPARQRVARSGQWLDHNAWLWHQEGGINIRERADRGRLEAAIAAVAPQLVCLGPIYKLYAVTARESDEIAAREVMGILDDLRTRYGFALVMEHHAPKKTGMVRELAPYGSSLWLRWPEFGFALTKDSDRNSDGEDRYYNLGRFRHDRVKNNWPPRLERSDSGFPWSASWDDNSWQPDAGAGGARRAADTPVGEEPF